MTGGRRIALALVAATALAVPAQAETRKLAADGTLHTIDVQTVGGKNSGTALKHTRRGVAGAPVSITIPGTEDAVIDREPALEIDPVSGQLLLVWSRYDGTNYNVFFSRFNGTSWAAAKAVVKTDGDDVEPQVLISNHYVHVGWRQSVPGQLGAFYRASLLSTTLELAYGPERIVTDDLWSVPPEGANTPGVSDPSPSDRIFAGVIYPSNTAEPGRCHIWGVRDEPVPIGYREIVTLPPTARGAGSVAAAWLGGRFTISYVCGSKFYYATRSNGVWSPTRSVDLTAPVTAADARWSVADMNARTEGH
jgi:hypothetical protein